MARGLMEEILRDDLGLQEAPFMTAAAAAPQPPPSSSPLHNRRNHHNQQAMFAQMQSLPSALLSTQSHVMAAAVAASAPELLPIRLLAVVDNSGVAPSRWRMPADAAVRSAAAAAATATVQSASTRELSCV